MNENLIAKKEKYEKLKEKIISKYKEDIKNIDGIMEVIENNNSIYEDDNLDTIIFKKYLELENVSKVAKHVSDLGYRIKTNSYIGERKYTSNDISEILDNEVEVEVKLKEVVKNLFYKNCADIFKRWG